MVFRCHFITEGFQIVFRIKIKLFRVKLGSVSNLVCFHNTSHDKIIKAIGKFSKAKTEQNESIDLFSSNDIFHEFPRLQWQWAMKMSIKPFYKFRIYFSLKPYSFVSQSKGAVVQSIKTITIRSINHQYSMGTELNAIERIKISRIERIVAVNISYGYRFPCDCHSLNIYFIK